VVIASQLEDRLVKAMPVFFLVLEERRRNKSVAFFPKSPTACVFSPLSDSHQNIAAEPDLQAGNQTGLLDHLANCEFGLINTTMLETP
jgi:hypothetical protein